MIKVEQSASKAIQEFFAGKGTLRPVRIELQSSGCCDSTLGLKLDEVRESDLIEKIDGLTFVMSPDLNSLAGEVTISYVDEAGKKGFVIVSDNPISEWAGFGVCQLMT